jgi:hypothetical protein
VHEFPHEWKWVGQDGHDTESDVLWCKRCGAINIGGEIEESQLPINDLAEPCNA